MKQSSYHYFTPGTPKIIRWLVRYSGGLIKNERQATRVLLAIVMLLIITSLTLFFVYFSGPNVPSEALEQPEYGLPKED